MRLRGALLWPVRAVAAWVDEKPLSAAGVLVAAGALAGLAAFCAGVEFGEGGLVYGGVTLEAVTETARRRPAYAVAAAAGATVFLLYDG